MIEWFKSQVQGLKDCYCWKFFAKSETIQQHWTWPLIPLESLLIKSNVHVHVADWSSLLLQYPYPVVLTVEVHEALQVQVTDLKLPVLNAAAASPVTGMDDGISTNFCDCFKRVVSGLGLSDVSNIFHSSLVPCQEKDLRNLPYIIFIQHQHLPLSLLIHWTNMGRSVPHKIKGATISFLLLNQPSNSWRSIVSVNPRPSQLPQLSTAPAATQRLSSPTTFWKVVPSESPPTTKPRSSQDFSGLRFLFQHKGGTMENIPPIHLLHFLKWKCTSPEKFIIDPSDKARILASWVHPKVKHAIPEIQRNLFGVSNIRLGNYTKRKVITLATFRAFFRKIPFQ